MRPALATIGGAVIAIACGGEATPESQSPEAAGSASDAERYLPLEHGTVFSYATHSEETGERGLLVMQIERPRPARVELRVGSRVQRLDVTPAGIADATGGFLLKPPITAGATWPGRSGLVTVTAARDSVTVPAGTFTDCIDTVEEGQKDGVSKRVLTVYCARVGIVTLTVEATGGGAYLSESLELKSFGARVDINQL